MDITKQIEALIDALKADKSMAHPWKNYAISDATRLQAVIEKGTKMTNKTPPEEYNDTKECTCLPGQKASVSCPTHGINL